MSIVQAVTRAFLSAGRGIGLSTPARACRPTLRQLLTLGFAAASLAACAPRPTASTAPQATATPLPTPDLSLSGAEIARRSRDAMARLSSFEAHFVWVARIPGSGSFSDAIWSGITDYRYEPPDRHSYVSFSPDSGKQFEARWEGKQFFTRDGKDAPWACEIWDIEPPRVTSYAPRAEDYVGVDATSLGGRYHFRRQEPHEDASLEPDTDDVWVEPGTYRVLKTISISHRPDEHRYEFRDLSAFDRPRQIYPPGPCVTATPMVEDAAEVAPESP